MKCPDCNSESIITIVTPEKVVPLYNFDVHVPDHKSYRCEKCWYEFYDAAETRRWEKLRKDQISKTNFRSFLIAIVEMTTDLFGEVKISVSHNPECPDDEMVVFDVQAKYDDATKLQNQWHSNLIKIMPRDDYFGYSNFMVLMVDIIE